VVGNRSGVREGGETTNMAPRMVVSVMTADPARGSFAFAPLKGHVGQAGGGPLVSWKMGVELVEGESGPRCRRLFELFDESGGPSEDAEWEEKFRKPRGGGPMPKLGAPRRGRHDGVFWVCRISWVVDEWKDAGLETRKFRLRRFEGVGGN